MMMMMARQMMLSCVSCFVSRVWHMNFPGIEQSPQDPAHFKFLLVRSKCPRSIRHMSTYVSALNFYQMPDANIVSQNTALNAAISGNKTGRTSATGVYFKYNTAAADNIDRPLSDPYEVCLKGQDWTDNTINYKITDNLTPGTGKTTIGCVATGPLTSISDIRVSNEFSCNTKERRIKSMIFPAAYEKMKAQKDPTKEAMHTFGITDDAALCVTDDVMNPNRVVDFLFTKGSCPSDYTLDPNKMNGFAFCKKFGPKPSAEVLAKFQKQLDDAEAARVAEELAAEEEAWAELTFSEKFQKSKTYQLYAALGTVSTISFICVICVSILLMSFFSN